MKRRKVYPGEVHHIYQRTLDQGVLFYSVKDYLVFFTLYCSLAQKHGITVLALCPMPDHLHNAVVAQSQHQLSEFVKEYTQSFALLWNKSRRRKGDLFHHGFGCSIKLGNKQVRTIINYNYNNPVERKLAKKAEDYRWNFLAYYKNGHPFSARGTARTMSWKLKMALKEVQAYHSQGKYLGYTLLDRLFKSLEPPEQQQLTDTIISLWNIVDYDAAIAYYGSFESMVRSFHDNTGSEYEIKEDKDSYSDSVYQDCTRYLLKEKLIEDVFVIPTLPNSRKLELFRLLRLRTAAEPKQLYKYLHLPLPKCKTQVINNQDITKNQSGK